MAPVYLLPWPTYTLPTKFMYKGAMADFLNPQTPRSHDTFKAAESVGSTHRPVRPHYVPPTQHTGWQVEASPPPTSYRSASCLGRRRSGVRGRWVFGVALPIQHKLTVHTGLHPSEGGKIFPCRQVYLRGCRQPVQRPAWNHGRKRCQLKPTAKGKEAVRDQTFPPKVSIGL